MSDVLLLHAGIADSPDRGEPQVEALEAAGHRPARARPARVRRGAARAGDGSRTSTTWPGSSTRPAAVVGCSFGGRVALELAVARPELVERLVLVSAALRAGSGREVAQAGFAEEEAALERGDLAAAAAAAGADVARRRTPDGRARR